jgi:hypothetical protein
MLYGYELVTLLLGHKGMLSVSIWTFTDKYPSNLNRRRYAQNDDTLYVAPEDERTDYVRLLAIFLTFVQLWLPYSPNPR